MSPILVAGLTIAMRFILDDCCARAASGHVAAAPSAVMKSRRRMYPPEGKPLRRLKPNTLRRGGGRERGSQSTPNAATQCPFGVINGPSVASELGPFIPRQRTSPACPWGSITYVDLHGMEAMMTGKLSPEGEAIAAYGAAMVAVFQVLINCLEENHSFAKGQVKSSSYWSLDIIYRR